MDYFIRSEAWPVDVRKAHMAEHVVSFAVLKMLRDMLHGTEKKSVDLQVWKYRGATC